VKASKKLSGESNTNRDWKVQTQKWGTTSTAVQEREKTRATRRGAKVDRWIWKKQQKVLKGCRKE